MPKIYFALIDAKDTGIVNFGYDANYSEHNYRIKKEIEHRYLKELKELQERLIAEFEGQLENETNTEELDWRVIDRIDKEIDPTYDYKEYWHLWYS